MSSIAEIQLIAVFISLACAIPGTFLVLRRMSMMSDSITHTILLGIVLAFFITHDLGSPLLIIGAALMGVFTVWLTELLSKARLVGEDSAIGLVYPLLFSVAIILISRFAQHIHIDTNTVLLGELAFAPFDRLILFGTDVGARFIYTSGLMLAVNVVLVLLFFKELKIVSFDPVAASVLGISLPLFHYGLMTIVSMTTVVAFEAVGAILVVAFMIGPPSAAYLLTKTLKGMLFYSSLFAVVSALAGFRAALILDVSIAGSMAVAVGLVFTLVFIFAPDEGLMTSLLKKSQQRRHFDELALLYHLSKHPDNMDGIGWNPPRLNQVLQGLEKHGSILLEGDQVKITPSGLNALSELEASL